eukprot:1975207-Rhodomonas_salina.1
MATNTSNTNSNSNTDPQSTFPQPGNRLNLELSTELTDLYSLLSLCKIEPRAGTQAGYPVHSGPGCVWRLMNVLPMDRGRNSNRGVQTRKARTTVLGKRSMLPTGR